MLVFALFSTAGYVYGRVVGTVRGYRDVPVLVGQALKDMASFLVLAFILGQFIALFNWSGIGSWIAVTGADALQNAGVTVPRHHRLRDPVLAAEPLHHLGFLDVDPDGRRLRADVRPAGLRACFHPGGLPRGGFGHLGDDSAESVHGGAAGDGPPL